MDPDWRCISYWKWWYYVIYVSLPEGKSMMIMDLAILLVTFLGWWVHVTRNQWRKRDLQRSGIRRSAWITWDVSFFLLAVLLSIYVLPSRELTYPPKMAFWRWFFFSRLVGYVSIPWRVSSYQQILRDLLLTKQAGLSLAFGVFFGAKKSSLFWQSCYRMGFSQERISP